MAIEALDDRLHRMPTAMGDLVFAVSQSSIPSEEALRDATRSYARDHEDVEMQTLYAFVLLALENSSYRPDSTYLNLVGTLSKPGESLESSIARLYSAEELEILILRLENGKLPPRSRLEYGDGSGIVVDETVPCSRTVLLNAVYAFCEESRTPVEGVCVEDLLEDAYEEARNTPLN